MKYACAWLLGAGTILSAWLWRASEGDAADGWRVLFVFFVLGDLAALVIRAIVEEGNK